MESIHQAKVKSGHLLHKIAIVQSQRNSTVHTRVAQNIKNTTLALAKDLHCFRGSASFDPQKSLSALASNQLQSLQ